MNQDIDIEREVDLNVRDLLPYGLNLNSVPSNYNPEKFIPYTPKIKPLPYYLNAKKSEKTENKKTQNIDITQDFLNAKEREGREKRKGRENVKGYFHPVDTQPTYDNSVGVTSFNQSGCQNCPYDMKTSEIRRRIEKCQLSLERREIDRRNKLKNAYDKFSMNTSYKHKGTYYNNPEQLFWVNGVDYIDRHQYDGFRHTLNNLEECQSIITDRITNPYYVFFLYPDNIRDDDGRILNTSEYKHFFHSSHPTQEEAVDTITWEVATVGTKIGKSTEKEEITVSNRTKEHRLYFVLYFGDDEDDGDLVWNPGGEDDAIKYNPVSVGEDDAIKIQPRVRRRPHIHKMRR